MQQHRAHASSFLCWSLDIVIGVGSATQVKTDEGTATNYDEQSNEDVDQGGDPEGKQVQCLVAVGIHICCALVKVGLVNRVDPHVT